jgi:hypothetical protein
LPAVVRLAEKVSAPSFPYNYPATLLGIVCGFFILDPLIITKVLYG